MTQTEDGKVVRGFLWVPNNNVCCYVSYLPRGLDTLPETEVKQNNHHSQTGSQLPARTAQVINTMTVLNMKDPSSEKKEDSVSHIPKSSWPSCF